MKKSLGLGFLDEIDACLALGDDYARAGHGSADKKKCGCKHSERNQCLLVLTSHKN